MTFPKQWILSCLGLTQSKLIVRRFHQEWSEIPPANTSGSSTSGIRRPTMTGRVNPRPPHGLRIVRGSAYGAFSRDFVRYVLEDQKSRDLLQWSRATYSPDEHYWATLQYRFVNRQLETPGYFAGKFIAAASAFGSNTALSMSSLGLKNTAFWWIHCFVLEHQVSEYVQTLNKSTVSLLRGHDDWLPCWCVKSALWS
jgi:hypothetical protein